MIDFRARTVDGDVWVISAIGELDTYTSSAFFDCIEAEIENGKKKIIVDCSDLNYLSSAGIGTLIRVHSRMKKLGGDVILAALRGTPADVLRLTHLDRVLGIYDDVEHACQSFKA